MRFVISDRSDRASAGKRDVCYLARNTWDDFGFKTTYDVVVYGEGGEEYDLGSTRIMFSGQKAGLVLPATFDDEIGDESCSLGTNRNYYVRLMEMPLGEREAILRGLRDCAIDHERYERFKNEDAFKISLLRSATEQDVLSNYPRILNGQTELTPFFFSYVLSPALNEEVARAARAEEGPLADDVPFTSLKFSVHPGSKPPSNVHVLIGRNGVGKTRVLAGMADALTNNQAASFGFPGCFEFDQSFNRMSSDFLNLIIVSFSAFDRFDPISVGSARTDKSIPFYYIGVKRFITNKDGELTDEIGVKSPDDLNDDFRSALQTICQDDARMNRWVKALKTLSSDPGIRDLHAHEILGPDPQFARDRVIDQVSHMSSGHKIVLLTVTRLIENVSDRSLVLLDEPETHLHPPLLGSFMRALSELLVDSNGVAIVATHSPVVLQEVPAMCVWRLLGSRGTLHAERPDEETFAENVSVLTRKVFGLEIDQSGFYQLLRDQARNADYDEVEATFREQIGTEGRALLRAFTWKQD